MTDDGDDVGLEVHCMGCECRLTDDTAFERWVGEYQGNDIVELVCLDCLLNDIGTEDEWDEWADDMDWAA